MTTRLYASLEKALEEWVDQQCEGDEWPETFTGDRTVVQMATAARAVFEAVEEIQHYAKENGLWAATK